jgi:hypothetical protein
MGKLSFGLNATVSKSWLPTDDPGPVAAGTTPTAAQIAWGIYGANQPVPASPDWSGNARIAYEIGGDFPTLALAATILGPRLAHTALTDPNMLMLAQQDRSNITVPTSVQLRATASGTFPGVPSLLYRLSANVAAPAYTPYTVGGLNAYWAPGQTLKPDFQQLPRLTIIGGLEYRM